MGNPIRFLFDYVSPYSYLASTQIRALARRHGRDVEAVPVLFAAMLDAVGTRGPGEVPAKREYMFHDVVRIARALGLPIEPPATHPFNPLTALRVTGCVGEQTARWRLVDALYSATWVQAQRVDLPDVVARVAEGVGLDGRTLLEEAASAESKARLRGATEGVVAAGAFGVPTMLVDGQLYWGVDSLPYLERFLLGEADVDSAVLARWRAIVPSATRRATS
jgi:2-hydroxychromene-2-carboxylate isomerase